MKPINLNKARKARARAEAKAKADENAVKFGRSRAERDSDAARSAKSDKTHADHKRQRDD